MKKTLFAVAALALCGTAVADTHYASECQNVEFSSYIYGNGSNVVFVVDAPANLNGFRALEAGSMTLSFVGANTILANGSGGYSGLDFYNTKGPLAVIGDSSAKEYWYTALTSEDIKSVTLASTTRGFYAPLSASFEGLTESGSITLGNATVDYVGYHKVASIGAANALIKGDNQIALVAIEGTKQLALVGKISGAATPEPATATLSLMALAGLCARRRRH